MDFMFVVVEGKLFSITCSVNILTLKETLEEIQNRNECVTFVLFNKKKHFERLKMTLQSHTHASLFSYR